MPVDLRGLFGPVDAVLRRAVGVIAALAPARYWPALDEYLPVTGSAALSGIVTILAAAAVGIPGFLYYGTEMADMNNRIFLAVAVKPEAEGVLDSSTMAGMNVFALFGFLFLTGPGWATMYLGLTGFLRAVAAGFSDGAGDPILTGIDAVLRRIGHGTAAWVVRFRRESLEGPEIPDRIVAGTSLGIAGADLVILASRPKIGWDQGTVVIAGEKFFRVGAISERTIAGRLRTIYPLTEHRDLEVFRRAVHYDMPDDRPAGR